MAPLAVLALVLCWSIVSEPVCAASEEKDPQDITLLDQFRRLLTWSAVNDVTPVFEDSVEDDDYPDDQASEKAEVCQKLEKSTLQERFLMALSYAKRADRPWWFSYFAVFFNANMSCPANKRKEKEGATLHERFMRAMPGFVSSLYHILRRLRFIFEDAVTLTIEWLYGAYSSGVTILLLPILIGWLFERASEFLHRVKAGTEWNLIVKSDWMLSDSELALALEESFQGEESFTGPHVLGVASSYDAAKLPSEEV
ncbi:uncharacterized protein LOC142771340 [Rhipicephalus microplus]|uniref:uncharacterized protein LOC142771340 n=1 Tax=Rhipicephalus microplus TaxID=6941 RepID=UPI003F6B3F15